VIWLEDSMARFVVGDDRSLSRFSGSSPIECYGIFGLTAACYIAPLLDSKLGHAAKNKSEKHIRE
jgi:hypothetical protein